MEPIRTNGIPGGYANVSVINIGAATAPGFNALLIVGSARGGIPYDVGTGDKAIKAFSSEADAIDYYGKSPLTDALGYAKNGGAGTVHLLNAANLTRAEIVLADAVAANTLKLVANKYGAAENDIKVTIATDGTDVTMTLTPPKDTIFLTADSGTTSKQLNVEHTANIAAGDTIYLVANNVATPQAMTVVAVDPDNKRIEVSAVATTDSTTAQYARIFKTDTSNEEVYTYTTSTTVTDLIAEINSGNLFTASRESYSGNLPADQSAEYFQNLTSATPGTSPVATTSGDGDFDLVKAGLSQQLDEYENATGTQMRIISVVASEAAVHAVFAGLANERRALMKPVLIVVGTALADIDASTSASNYPAKRAENLNNDSVILCGMGINGDAGYQSFAPYFAGMIAASAPNSNLTNDSLSVASVEKTISSTNEVSLLKPLLAKGVVVPRYTNAGVVIARAISTLQENSTEWTLSNTTFLIQQRQIVDYVLKAGLAVITVFSGTNAEVIDVRMALDQMLSTAVTQGLIVDYSFLPGTKDGDTITVTPVVSPTVGVDFVLANFIVDMQNA